MSEFLLRLKTIFRRRQLDRDLEDELAFHLAMKQERQGMSENEARRALGNPTRFRETLRDLWTFAWLEALWQDARYGARMLRHNLGFTLVAVLSLAIGIGGNTAIFSLVNTIMLKSLAVRDPQQLRVLTWKAGRHTPSMSDRGYGDYDEATHQQTGGSFSYPMFIAIRKRLAPLADVFAFSPFEVAAMASGETHFAPSQSVSGNYFSVLGVLPLAGRTIETADDQPQATRVAVISYSFWERRFGLDPRVVGSAISLNGRPATVVGILPASVKGLNPGRNIDIYIPIAMQPEVEPEAVLSNNGFWWVQMFARIHPGASEPQFRAAGDVILRQMSLALVKPDEKNIDIPNLVVEPGGQGLSFVRRGFARPMAIAGAVVGLVLLIACANLANLLLARATARRREIAVRIAIGAGRMRLIRQLLTESVLLAFGGGAIGMLMTAPLAQLAIRFAAGHDSIKLDTSIDSATLAFTVTVSVLAAVLFGLAPAWRATRVDLSPALKEAGGRPAGGSAQLRAGRILVSAQVALSTLLLVGAGLFVRSLVNLSSVELGFNPERLLVFSLDPTHSGYKGERLVALYHLLREKIAAIPGVETVALMDHLLIAGQMSRTTISVPGYTSPPDDPARTWVMRGSDGFLTAMGMRILTGRDIAPSDGTSVSKVAVVNEAFVKRFFSGANPIGRTFTVDGVIPVQIVGVSNDAKYKSLRQTIQPTMYLDYEQWADRLAYMTVNIRSRMPPQAIMTAVRGIVAGVDRQLPIADLRTEQEQIAISLGPERFFAGFVGAFGLVAALLAAVGLYGVMAYNVARRTPEIGLRVALGAGRGDVQWLVLRESVILVVVGLAVGIPAAFALTRLLESSLYGVRPADPASFAAGSAVMLAIAAFAAWMPARRAARVDPLIALRYE